MPFGVGRVDQRLQRGREAVVVFGGDDDEAVGPADPPRKLAIVVPGGRVDRLDRHSAMRRDPFGHPLRDPVAQPAAPRAAVDQPDPESIRHVPRSFDCFDEEHVDTTSTKLEIKRFLDRKFRPP